MSNIDSLLLHSKTRYASSSYINQPAHALMIVGEPGAGKADLALAIAADLLGVSSPDLGKHRYFMLIEKPQDKQEIPIEAIRDLIKKMALKTQGQSAIKRVAVIKGADLLSEEAQNALLKVLEEPPADTALILTTLSKKNVLPTILSRSQVITAHGISEEEAVNYYAKDYDRPSIQNAWRLSGGTAELTKLIMADEQHPLKQAIGEAKTLLACDVYDRLLTLSAFSKDRQRLTNLLWALERILESLQRSPKNQKKSTAALLTENRRLIIELQGTLTANVSAKLVALQLALNLRP